LHASLLGATAGCLFGVTAGLLKLIGGVDVAQVGSGELALLVVALAGTGIVGTAINQRAYQIAPLAFSMPLVNVVDVLVAIGFGGVVFGEVPGHGAGGMVVQLLALSILAAGLREIARLEPRSEDPAPVEPAPREPCSARPLAQRRVRVAGATR
jgi:hypothetical protein